MNARLIEAPSGPLLVFRDLDEDSNNMIVFMMYGADGTIVKQTGNISDMTTEQIQKHIRTMPQETANTIVRGIMNMLENPLGT